MDKRQECGVSGIIMNENKEILFTKRSLDDDFLPGFWDIPGGGLEYREVPQEGLARELKEECGIEVEIIRPVAVNSYIDHKIHKVEITFFCKAVSTEIKLDKEHSEYRWLKITDIGQIELSNYVKKILDSANQHLS